MSRLILVLAVAVLAAACARPAVDEVAIEPTADVGEVEPEVSTTVAAAEELPDLGAAPRLAGIDGWLQTDIDSLDDLRGKVVVVQFWTFGCFNCKNTLPNLRALYAEHAGDDFEVVGVHSPEFTYEEDPAAIAEAAEELGVVWPIALDTRQRSFFGWQGSPAYWPRTYVLDQEGVIRFDHIGEGAYDELNETVDALLG